MWLRRSRNDTGLEESRKALEHAKKKLAETHQTGAEVRRVSQSLGDRLDKNHFAEALEEIILGKKKAT